MMTTESSRMQTWPRVPRHKSSSAIYLPWADAFLEPLLREVATICQIGLSAGIFASQAIESKCGLHNLNAQVHEIARRLLR
jgi:hypothetical protein